MNRTMAKSSALAALVVSFTVAASPARADAPTQLTCTSDGSGDRVVIFPLTLDPDRHTVNGIAADFTATSISWIDGGTRWLLVRSTGMYATFDSAYQVFRAQGSCAVNPNRF